MRRRDLSNSDHLGGILNDRRSPFFERDLRQLRTKLVRADAAELVCSARCALSRSLKRMAVRLARGELEAGLGQRAGTT